jgi:HSP20 family protein
MITINRIPTVNSLTRMHREMNDLFNAVFSGHPSGLGLSARAGSPAMNVWEDEKAWFIEAELPGYRMEDLDISVLADQVTVKGKREVAEPQGATFLRRERASNEFERTWTFPADVSADGVEAALNNGVLLLTLPKSPKVQPRKITVKTAKA